MGYFSDNELPFTRDNLDGFLRLPASDPGHQAAERWMQDHHAAAPTDSLRSEFLEFEADLYFRIVSSAIRKTDPNHMYLGSRFHGQALHDPELFRPHAEASNKDSNKGIVDRSYKPMVPFLPECAI